MRIALPTSLLTLVLLAAVAHAQIAAAVVAPGNRGVLELDENGRGVFAVVAINLGSPGGSLSPTGYCGGYDVTATGATVLGVCVLDEATGACAGPASLTSLRLAGEPVSSPPRGAFPTGTVKVFGVLVQAPMITDRITVTFTEWDRGTPVWPPRCYFPSENGISIGRERGAVSIRVAPGVAP